MKIDLGEFELENYVPPDPNAKPNYILDVAKSSSYQNQTEEYYQAYGKWRTKPKNHFGYSYIKDVREHTYIDGKGFLADGPDRNERIYLLNCFTLLGALMIIPQVLTYLDRFIISDMTNTSFFFNDFFMGITRVDNAPFKMVVISSVISILKLLIPIVAFLAITRFPRIVAFPKAKVKDYEMSISGISFLLMATILCRAGNLAVNWATSKVGIDFSSVSFIHTDDMRAVVFYAISEYIVVGILTEILFRGIILQFFRQYGDLFAIIVSCIANVVFCADISQLFNVALMSIVLALFTVRTGSLFTAVAMRLCSRLCEMVISIGLVNIDDSLTLLLECSASIIIVSFALVTYSKMISSRKINFNVSDSYTHLAMKEKFIIMVSSGTMVVWFVTAIVLTISSVRFI